MNKSYKIDYQLSQMAYFEGSDQVPTGRDYAELWCGLDVLHKQKVTGCFWPNEVPAAKNRKLKSRRMKIGDAAAVEPLLSNPDAFFSGGGAETRKDATRGCDRDFYLALSEASHSVFGPTPPYFHFTLSDRWITELLGVPSLFDILRRNFEILDRSRPFYGFVDLDRAEDIYNGFMYGSMAIANAPMDRSADKARWLRSVNLKRHQARSIYWGNYFGDVILGKVGGRESFLSYCREKTTSRYGTPTILIWEFTNGVFVSLSDSFSDCTPGGIVSTLIPRNIKWLYERLAEGNAIIGA